MIELSKFLLLNVHVTLRLSLNCTITSELMESKSSHTSKQKQHVFRLLVVLTSKVTDRGSELQTHLLNDRKDFRLNQLTIYWSCLWQITLISSHRYLWNTSRTIEGWGRLLFFVVNSDHL